MEGTKVGITERALIQRLNRKLKREDKKLLTARRLTDGALAYENSNLGRHYIVDVSRNMLTMSHVDIELLGREQGVLAAWEELAVEKQS